MTKLEDVVASVVTRRGDDTPKGEPRAWCGPRNVPKPGKRKARRPIIDPETEQCVMCGKYPKRTIRETWSARAGAVALASMGRKRRRAA